MSRSAGRLRSSREGPRHARPTTPGVDMAIQRMDNVLIVVEDLEAAKAFFAELGMELEGETQVEGPWVDRTVGLDGVRADIAMMRTPDGHGRVELSKFHTPPAVRAEPEKAPANTLGIRRIMFAVADIDDVVARLRRHGAELLDEIAQYEDLYRVCFLRGPLRASSSEWPSSSAEISMHRHDGAASPPSVGAQAPSLSQRGRAIRARREPRLLACQTTGGVPTAGTPRLVLSENRSETLPSVDREGPDHPSAQ